MNQLIVPENSKLSYLIKNHKNINVQLMLYKIYITLFEANPSLNFDSNFQLFLVHMGWIKIMSSFNTLITSPQNISTTIYKEFFSHLSSTEFIKMVVTLKFHSFYSTDYYRAFCTLVDRINYIDWSALEKEGCADYSFINPEIANELDNMQKLVKKFNQYTNFFKLE